VPGEYCPGEYSVNARGATKLVGTAQRLTRHGYLFSVVVLVGDPSRCARCSPRPTRCSGWNWDPATVGAVADEVPG
jgi:predicted metal-binding protein